MWLNNGTAVFQKSDQELGNLRSFAVALGDVARKAVVKWLVRRLEGGHDQAVGDADAQEIQLASRFVQEQGLASFCRVILNSNEFLYVR